MDFQNYLKSLGNFREELKREGNPTRSSGQHSPQDSSRRKQYATGGNVRQSERMRELAAKGRYGDTKLAKIGPRTAKDLDYLIHGGHKEINPRTGLREYPPKGGTKVKATTSKKIKGAAIPSKKKTVSVSSGIDPNYLRKQGSDRSCGASCAMMLSHHYNKGLPPAFKAALDANRINPKTVKSTHKTYKKKVNPTPASGYNSDEAVSEVYGESLPAAAYRVSPSGKGAEITKMAPKMGFKVGTPQNVPDLATLQKLVKKGKPGFLNLETPTGANHAALLTGYKGSELHIADPKNGKIERVQVKDVPYNLKPGSFLAKKEGYTPSVGNKKDYDIRGVKLKSGPFYITQASGTSK